MGHALKAVLSLVILALAGAARAEAPPPAGTVFRDCEAICPELVVIPAGGFMMGSPGDETSRYKDEGPRHKVTLAAPFAAGRFEVTFDEWDACVADGGCAASDGDKRVGGDMGWGRGRRPVINVNWADAQAYVAWLSRKTGKTYRLLTEAEWEYLARAGGTGLYTTGDNLSAADANYEDAGQNKTLPVGGFAPNPFGLYDMGGNVWEWVQDCYAASYDRASRTGAAGTSGDCGRHVLRGGAWDDPASHLRVAMRGRNLAGFRDNDFGFRIARDL